MATPGWTLYRDFGAFFLVAGMAILTEPITFCACTSFPTSALCCRQHSWRSARPRIVVVDMPDDDYQVRLRPCLLLVIRVYSMVLPSSLLVPVMSSCRWRRCRSRSPRTSRQIVIPVQMHAGKVLTQHLAGILFLEKTAVQVADDFGRAGCFLAGRLAGLEVELTGGRIVARPFRHLLVHGPWIIGRVLSAAFFSCAIPARPPAIQRLPLRKQSNAHLHFFFLSSQKRI